MKETGIGLYEIKNLILPRHDGQTVRIVNTFANSQGGRFAFDHINRATKYKSYKFAIADHYSAFDHDRGRGYNLRGYILQILILIE